MAGCTNKGVKQGKQVAALAVTTEKVVTQAKVMNDITVTALRKETNNTPPIQLARTSSTETQRLLGPHPFEKFDVDAWLATNAVARTALELKIAQHTDSLKMQYNQEKQLVETENKLIELGKVKEKEMNAKIWWQFWTWSMSSLIILGGVGLCVFTPIGPAVISGLIGFLWSAVPRIAGFFKLTTTKVIDNLARGNERWKNRVGQEPLRLPAKLDATYSTEEVKQLLLEERQEVIKLWKEEIAKATDTDDRDLIEHRKVHLDIMRERW